MFANAPLCFLTAAATILLQATLSVCAQTSSFDHESAGLVAEHEGRLREAFDDYLAALQGLPDSPPADEDQRLRERIIKIVPQLNPPPAVPEEAERRMIRGQTALKIAQDTNDLNAAASEFRQALRAAPWLAGAYFNLALVEEKQKDYADAIRSFKLYVMTAPKAEDLGAVRQKIIELEYLQERARGGASPETLSSTITAVKPRTSNAEGKALIAKVITRLGDESKLRSVKAIRQHVFSLRKTPQGDIHLDLDQTIVYPDHVYVKAQTPMGEMVTVITPQNASMSMGGQHRDMPPAMRDENLKVVKRDLIYVAQHADDSKFSFAGAGDDAVHGVQARTLIINADGVEVRWYVDPSNGQVLRAVFHTQSTQGPVERVVDYSDWRDTNGLLLPYERTITENGKASAEDTVKSIELDPAIDPQLFKP